MAEVVRYVNTASTAGGDGTTNNTTGATRAYASSAEWNTAEITNLVLDTDNHVLKCCGTAADTAQLNMSGWTMSAVYNFLMEGNPDEADGWNKTGLYSTSHYRIETVDASNIKAAKDSFSTFRNLQGATSGTGNNNPNVYLKNTVDVLEGCILRQGCTGTKGKGVIGDYAPFAGSISNNIIYSTDPLPELDSYGISFKGEVSSTGRIYNNTVYGFREGIYAPLATQVGKCNNNTVFGCTDDFDMHANWTLDYNASDDGDGTNAQTLSGTRADDFVDVTTYDFHPVESGVLPSNGLGSATDSNVPLADIKDVTRSTSAPSIGAIEYGAVSSFVPKMGIY